MNPVCKSFNDLSHQEKNYYLYNLFLICSSIFLIISSFIAIFKFIHNHCSRAKYTYRYNTCDCGCQNDYECNDDNCQCQ